MAQEIERKFLVKGTSYLSMATKTIHIRQGYISRNIDATVRIRITDNEAFVTIKAVTTVHPDTNGNIPYLWQMRRGCFTNVATERFWKRPAILCHSTDSIGKSTFSTELTKGSPLQKSSFRMKTPVSAYPRLQGSK